MLRARRRVFFSTALFLLASAALAQSPSSLSPGEKPADAPPQWKEWIGEYGPDNFIYSVRESQGRLWISSSRGGEWQFFDAPIEKYEQAMSVNGVPLPSKAARSASPIWSNSLLSIPRFISTFVTLRRTIFSERPSTPKLALFFSALQPKLCCAFSRS